MPPWTWGRKIRSAQPHACLKLGFAALKLVGGILGNHLSNPRGPPIPGPRAHIGKANSRPPWTVYWTNSWGGWLLQELTHALLPKCVIAHVSWRGLHLLPKLWRPTRAHKKSRTQFWLSETSGIIYHRSMMIDNVHSYKPAFVGSENWWYCKIHCQQISASIFMLPGINIPNKLLNISPGFIFVHIRIFHGLIHRWAYIRTTFDVSNIYCTS
jgi:hypothetical protein